MKNKEEGTSSSNGISVANEKSNDLVFLSNQ